MSTGGRTGRGGKRCQIYLYAQITKNVLAQSVRDMQHSIIHTHFVVGDITRKQSFVQRLKAKEPQLLVQTKMTLHKDSAAFRRFAFG